MDDAVVSNCDREIDWMVVVRRIGVGNSLDCGVVI